jgi:hypothetical protein
MSLCSLVGGYHILKEPTAHIFSCENGVSRLLWNVGNHQLDHMASHLRRRQFCLCQTCDFCCCHVKCDLELLTDWLTVITSGNLLEVHWICFSCCYSVCSNEASWDPREIGADADTWPQLVRPTIMCDNRWWPIWRTYVAYIQSQVMNPPAMACHLPYGCSHKTHDCCDIVHSGGKLVKWSGSVAVPNMITSFLRG